MRRATPAATRVDLDQGEEKPRRSPGSRRRGLSLANSLAAGGPDRVEVRLPRQGGSVLRRLLRVFMPIALAAGLVGASTTTAGADDPSDAFTTVATDLHNPRQMAFGADGALYVAEAGTGQVNATDQTGGCATGPEGDEVCVGNTSSLTVIEEPSGSS